MMGKSDLYLGGASRRRVCSRGGSDTLLSDSELANLSQAVSCDLYRVILTLMTMRSAYAYDALYKTLITAISEEELMDKLKFVAKGEPKGKLTFRMPIPEAMISMEIKESDAYLNYLAKYPNAQSGAPTFWKGSRTKAIHATLVLEKDVNKQVDEAYNAHLKLKLKAQKQISPAAQLFLDLKKGAKESKRQRILEEIRKASKEGSGAAPESLNHSDSSDNSIWKSTDDDKTKSDNSDNGDDDDDSDKDSDDEEDQTTSFEILVHEKEPVQPQPELQPQMVPLLDTITEVQEEIANDQVMESPPAATTNAPLTKSKKKRAHKILKKEIQRKNDSKKAIMQKLEEHEKKLDALA
ncbi:hypothetical protein Tco_1483223 [Tanacetum coccineum]